ncbi:hypothetical protein V2G26_017184 [Clonostachys chloroleuca]
MNDPCQKLRKTLQGSSLEHGPTSIPIHKASKDLPLQLQDKVDDKLLEFFMFSSLGGSSYWHENNIHIVKAAGTLRVLSIRLVRRLPRLEYFLRAWRLSSAVAFEYLLQCDRSYL